MALCVSVLVGHEIECISKIESVTDHVLGIWLLVRTLLSIGSTTTALAMEYDRSDVTVGLKCGQVCERGTIGVDFFPGFDFAACMPD